MAINIVIGPSWSGKYQFIQQHFPEYELLSVGNLQRRMLDENPDADYFNVIVEAHERIIEEFVERISKGKAVVMAHTLYKPMRREAYIEKIRKVTNEPIDIYVMQPSDDQILRYIEEDTERVGDLSHVKSELRQLEIPATDEGFAHVYVVNEIGVQDWSNKTREKKIINSKTTLSLIDCSEKKNTEAIAGFGSEPFKHVCEVCGMVKIMNSKEAFDEGWDYPGEEGFYKTMPGYGFGIMSPRTCGDCVMTDTVYWSIVAEGKPVEQLNERQVQAIERIVQEPDILRM